MDLSSEIASLQGKADSLKQRNHVQLAYYLQRAIEDLKVLDQVLLERGVH